VKEFVVSLAVAAVALAGAVGVSAQTPEQSLAFAEQLYQEGEDQLALLEFKRCAYMHPHSPQAPEALYCAGIICLTERQSFPQAQAALDRVVREYPHSPTAAKAREVRAFLDAGYDHDGQPVIAFVRAQNAENRHAYADAAAQYLGLAEKWPSAKLAVPALLAGCRLQIEELRQAEAAQKNLRQLSGRRLAPEHAAEALYYDARATDVLSGGGREARDAYRKAVAAAPDAPWAAQARERADEIEKDRMTPRRRRVFGGDARRPPPPRHGHAAPAFARQYDTQHVRPFNLLAEGYDENKVYVERIEIAVDASPEQVVATLEDALAKLVEEPPDAFEAARVEAYYNFPISRAGIVTWKPGDKPAYQIQKRRTQDVLKDSLFNILKSR